MEFLERTQPYLVFDVITRAARIVGQLLDADDDADLAGIAAHRDELGAPLPLLGLERFDRRAVNRPLVTCAAAGPPPTDSADVIWPGALMTAA